MYFLSFIAIGSISLMIYNNNNNNGYEAEKVHDCSASHYWSLIPSPKCLCPLSIGPPAIPILLHLHPLCHPPLSPSLLLSLLPFITSHIFLLFPIHFLLPSPAIARALLSATFS